MARSFIGISDEDWDPGWYTARMELCNLLLLGAGSSLMFTSEAHWPASLNSCRMCCLAITPLVGVVALNHIQMFKSFLLGSQDLKVNLCRLQQDKRSDSKGKNDVGIAEQNPHYSYTLGTYGKGPTGDYTTCTYIASKYTAFSINNDRYLIIWP